MQKFGVCCDVIGDAFLEEISVKNVVTVVLLYEPNVLSSIKMYSMLDDLAVKHINYKFLRFNVIQNEVSVDRTTLPILQFYENGDSIHIAFLEEELGRNFTIDDVDW